MTIAVRITNEDSRPDVAISVRTIGRHDKVSEHDDVVGGGASITKHVYPGQSLMVTEFREVDNA